MVASVHIKTAPLFFDSSLAEPSMMDKPPLSRKRTLAPIFRQMNAYASHQVLRLFAKRIARFLIIALALTLASGCQKSDLDSLHNQIDSFYADSAITQEEFKELVGIVASSKARAFERFKNAKNQVDEQELGIYVRKRLEKRNVKAPKIWNPESTDNIPQSFNINVFIENSGSINGYLNAPSTQFKNSVYSLLTRLKLFVDKDSLNLYFINQDNQLLFANASNSDIEKFKDILNPAAFAKISAGRTGATDINDLIKRCLQKSDDRNLSVFISDCIYSPGKKRPDAAMYLAEQKHGIYLNFASELKNRNSDLAVVVLRLQADFKGIYYDRQDNKIEFKTPIPRPFYMWFIGARSQIQRLLASKILEELDGGYLNKAIFYVPSSQNLKFKILAQPLYGKFNRKNLSQMIIEEAEIEKDGRNKGLFGFKVATDFSLILQDPEYFLDIGSYHVSNPKYKIERAETTDKNDPNLAGFTHLLKIKTDQIVNETLVISLIAHSPQWATDFSSTDDSKILSDEEEKNKTFGLKYLIEGVSDAFYPKSALNALGSINIKIQKKQ